MEDNQEHVEEGWQAHDLRSGVAKVYAEAKRRTTIGVRVAAVWAVMVLVYGALDMAGIATVAPPIWDFVAGAGVVLLAAIGLSRTPGPMLGAAAVVLADLVFVAYRIPALLERGESWDMGAVSVRVILAPIALTIILNGYFGALSIQAFKQGFSPGADWRTRINPFMLQVVVFGSCAAALVAGVGTWFGAIRGGFAQTNVEWFTKDRILPQIELQTARPEVGEAETDGKTQEEVVKIKVLKPGENDAPEDEKLPEYPENARPIPTLAGLDAFAKREVEEAFEFGVDADEQGCVLEGQGRQDRCRDDRCKYWSRVFVRACLTRARETANYCDGVPEPTAVEPGLMWAQRMCAGRNFEMCREILYAVQGHCHPPDDMVAAPSGAKPAGKTTAGKTAGKGAAKVAANPGARTAKDPEAPQAKEPGVPDANEGAAPSPAENETP